MNFDTFVSEELCPEDYQTLLPYFKNAVLPHL